MRIGIMSTLIIQIFSMENVLCKLHFRFVKNSVWKMYFVIYILGLQNIQLFLNFPFMKIRKMKFS